MSKKRRRGVETIEGLTKEANNGDAHVQWQMGLLYHHGGHGLKKDDRKAVQWYELAAAQGHPMAEGALGEFYFHGKGGLPIDRRRAVELYTRAAEKGEIASMGVLAFCYFESRGVVCNVEKGRDWLKRGIQMGDQFSRVLACEYKPNYDIKEVILKYEEVTQHSAMRLVGWYYSVGGAGLDKNIRSALWWYEQAAKQGDVVAQRALWVLSSDEYLSACSISQGIKWLRKAAKAGHADSLAGLGCVYDEGKYIPKNVDKAKKYYEEAAKQGSEIAYCNLGVMYETQHDLSTAIHYYKLAAKESNIAQFNLYHVLRHSEPTSAYRWYLFTPLPPHQSHLYTLDRLIEAALAGNCDAQLECRRLSANPLQTRCFRDLKPLDDWM